MAFATNIFINCPFDDKYKPVLKSIIFTTICCGFEPQLSENKDSSEPRLASIQDLIEKSKFSVHDLSRMTSNKKGELARFNMPFELGLDFGCKRYKGGIYSDKKCLILDSEAYRYKKSLSDISGNDISSHDNSPEKATSQIRNWLQKHRELNQSILPTGSKIWVLYNEFEGILQTNLPNKTDFDEMPRNEYFQYIREFLKAKGVI
jgi:hypothetical protein